MTEFFDILLDAAHAAGGGDLERCYHLLNITLHRSVDQKLAGSNIHFGGLFAKTDFLCKEYGVEPSVVQALNALRHFLRDSPVSGGSFFRDRPVSGGSFFRDSSVSGGASARNNQDIPDWRSDVQCLALFISKIYNEPIPQELKEFFPHEHHNRAARKIVRDCVHMVVESWTENAITGNTDELGKITVTIPSNYEYIIQLLSEGALINLVKLNADNVPELIIYQPDYLVDVSTIANCFESYADTPYCALINRLKTVPPTKAIHLGNLASQFLDEEVHGGESDYAASVTDFFHHHALDMAAATDIDASFHKEAMVQKENIRIAVHETLEKEVGHFDAKQSLLEPSFFCEILGLQGRMDLLQRDYRVLIEQKSGKGGFPQHDPDVPVFVEKHYVQMLLYMALLHYGYKREGHVIKNSDIQSFLLYSKYKKGLVRLGPAPELLHKALMLRNQIAFCDISYANGGAANVLSLLNPEKLRRKKMSDKFWQTWIRPELTKVLDPIQNATPLEKAYFFRMLQFVAKEHLHSKMGNNNKESSGFASKWHDSLEDKLLAGDIFYNLSIKEKSTEELVLETDLEDSAVSANFRKGDIVILYPYKKGSEPDVRKTMVHRCTIVDISIADEKLTVKLKLKSPQTDSSVFSPLSPSEGQRGESFLWAIEHDFYESSSTGLYRSLHQFLSAPAERKALILGQRQPETDESQKLIGDYGQFNDLVLKAKQAKDLFLVIGPPGTGKTSFGLMNILKEQLEEQNASILLMAYTNRAVDEICSKLVEEGLDFLRIGNPLSAEAEYHTYLLENKSKECRNIGEIKTLIDNTRIIVGTTTAITGASVSLFALKTFDLAIIDEASQILEPQLLGLLSTEKIRKFVLIGDHKQLPAVVQQSPEDSKVTDPLLLDIGLTDCRNSFFERMLRSCPHYLLRNQGRMHPEISDYPNNAFYESQLGIAGLPHQLENIEKPRLTFIPVAKPEQSVSDKVNEAEAKVIAQEVLKVYEEYGDKFDPLSTVGVIVPYRNQIAAIRNEISKLAIERNYSPPFGGGQEWGAIDTVERYQGSQRDVIIYGFTVQYKYQLKFLTSATFRDPVTGALIDRRLNVALTRAKKREIIVGNPEILRHAEVFRGLLDYCKVK